MINVDVNSVSILTAAVEAVLGVYELNPSISTPSTLLQSLVGWYGLKSLLVPASNSLSFSVLTVPK